MKTRLLWLLGAVWLLLVGGDAMVRISEVRLDVRWTKFDWAMTQAQLQALTGRPWEDG